MDRRWLHSFQTFLKDVGYAPSPNHSIDRIDNNGHYKPDNCRWATNKEQHANTSRNIMVGDVCLKDYCNANNLRYDVVWQRIRRSGQTVEEAISQPTPRRKYRVDL